MSPAAVAHYTEQWRDFANGDGRTGGQSGFPFLRRRGPLALIGVSSAVPTAPFMATGRVGAAQAAALGSLLAETAREGLFRVVLIHHPVAEHAATRMRRLIDAGRVRAVIAEHGAELVLHGHNHRTSVTTVPGPHGPVPVVGATATSLRPAPAPCRRRLQSLRHRRRTRRLAAHPARTRGHRGRHGRDAAGTGAGRAGIGRCIYTCIQA